MVSMTLTRMRTDWNSSKRNDRRNRIIDLQEDRPVRTIDLLVVRKYPRRQIKSSRWTGPLAAAAGRDETGVIGLVLWGEQCDLVKPGDVIRIENGWCRSSSGRLVVSTGRTGRLTRMES